MTTPTRANLITAFSSLSGNAIGNLAVSQELPWIESGRPLYVKNPRRVYVDRPVRDEQTVITTLDNSIRAVERTTTIRAYVSVDAKTQPSGFETAITNISGLKTNAVFGSQVVCECNISQDFEEDLLITEFEFQFKELVVN